MGQWQDMQNILNNLGGAMNSGLGYQGSLAQQQQLMNQQQASLAYWNSHVQQHLPTAQIVSKLAEAIAEDEFGWIRRRVKEVCWSPAA